MTKKKYKPLDKSKIERLTVENSIDEDATSSLIQTSEIPHFQTDLQSQNAHQKSRSDYIKGIILIILVDILWIVGSEIVQVLMYVNVIIRQYFIQNLHWKILIFLLI